MFKPKITFNNASFTAACSLAALIAGMSTGTGVSAQSTADAKVDFQAKTSASVSTKAVNANGQQHIEGDAGKVSAQSTTGASANAVVGSEPSGSANDLGAEVPVDGAVAQAQHVKTGGKEHASAVSGRIQGSAKALAKGAAKGTARVHSQAKHSGQAMAELAKPTAVGAGGTAESNAEGAVSVGAAGAKQASANLEQSKADAENGLSATLDQTTTTAGDVGADLQSNAAAVNGEVAQQVNAALATELGSTVETAVGASVESAIDSAIESSIESTVESTIDSTVEAAVESAVEQSLESSVAGAL